ncbi:MAG: hypothetical protein ACRDVE_16695 [Actinocrinis sp.]
MNVTDEIRRTLTDPKPLYALAGGVDLAASTLRDAPTLLTEVAGTVTTIAGRITSEAPERIAKVQARIAEVPGALTLDPRNARASFLDAVGMADPQVLRDRVQSLALVQVGRVLEAAGKAVETYDELAERGKSVVERYRGGAEAPAVNVTVVVEQVVVDEDATGTAGPTEAPAAASTFTSTANGSANKAAPKIEDAEVADAPAAKPQAKKAAATPRKRTAAPKAPKA